MTASKPKDDLIKAADRPQSPDHTDMLNPKQKQLSNASQECVKKNIYILLHIYCTGKCSQCELQCLPLMLR